MAFVETGMAAADGGLHLATSMWAVIQLSVFTFSRSVTRLLAEMDSAFESLFANLSTRDVLGPTGLVLEYLLAAHTFLLNEIWTLRAALLVAMAVMLGLRMTTRLRPLTLMRTWWWFSSARLWWVENSTSAITCDLLENGLSAASAWSSVAEILADVLWIAALKFATTGACADVLGLEILGCSASGSLHLSPCCETGRGMLLAWTTTLSAFVASAVENGTADAHTLWALLQSLVADRSRSGTSTSTVDCDDL